MFSRVISRLVFILPLSLVTAVMYARPAVAANFNYRTTSTYRVEADGSTRVTQQYTVTNRTPQLYLTELKITTPTENISALRVTYSDGAAIPSGVARHSQTVGDVVYPVQEIRLRFPRQNYGAGRSWSFTISYLAGGMVETKGGARTVYIPAVQLSNPSDDYQVVLDVPQTFGRPHFAGSKAAGQAVGERDIYRFDRNQVTQSSLALTFGDSTIYRLKFKYPLHNPSPLPRKLTATLPPDLGNQQSYLNSLNPAPNSISLDRDGNVLASYLLGPRQKLDVSVDISGQAQYLEYDLARSGRRSDIPAELVDHYTAPTRYWPTDGAVADAARSITDDNAPVINNVRAVYQFVIDKLSYNNDKIKFNIRQGAEKALANPSNAVCLEYSDLTIAMLRSIGIPARMPVGYAYSGSLKESKGVTDALHSWVEAYVPGVGWISVDPTWGEKFDQFGRSDLDHFAFAVWGENDQLPEAVMAGRQSLGYQYEDTALTYDSSLPETSDAGVGLSVRRWAVLPLLSLDFAFVTAPAHRATDSNLLQSADRHQPLGSLAPGQRISKWQWNIGSRSLEHAEYRFARADGANVLVLASSSAPPNYWPMGVLIGSLVVALTLVMIRLRSKSRRSGKTPESLKL